jgi:hypothetical protein
LSTAKLQNYVLFHKRESDVLFCFICGMGALRGKEEG